MRYRHLAVVAACSACGAVNNLPGDAAAGDAPPADAPPARIFHGMVPQTSPVTFGNDPCIYTATLRQTDVQIGILPSGQVTGGQVQTLYQEAITSANCPFTPADPTISNYTFASAAAGGSGMTLTFQEKPGDTPGATLVIGLSKVGATYQAQLTFHRTDLTDVLNWTVMMTATLAQQ